MANEVISTYERVDRVISDFSKQVGDYHSDMSNELSNLSSAISSLGSGWEGEDYDRFAKSLTEKINRIQDQLRSVDNLKSYLEDVSREFKQYLDQLREASEE